MLGIGDLNSAEDHHEKGATQRPTAGGSTGYLWSIQAPPLSVLYNFHRYALFKLISTLHLTPDTLKRPSHSLHAE